MASLPLLFENYNNTIPWLQHRVILCGLVGSRGYGIHTESSDWDFRGICIPPKEYVLGNLHTFHQTKFSKEKIEVEIFGIKKFFALAVDCNPNIVEMLFLEEYLPLPKFQGKFFSKLLNIRNLFLSQRAKYTFGGYAHAQLKRMETHRKWLLSPPTHLPTREEFGLSPLLKTVSREELGSIEAMEKEGKNLQKFYSDEVLDVYFKERAYANKKREWGQYINWQTHRNKERAELEAKCGYDAKHACHLVRLLAMGIEILSGTVAVKRTWDRDVLLAIRNGAFSYGVLMEQVRKLQQLLDEAHTLSSLPHDPPRERIDEYLVSLLEEAYYGWK